MALPIDIVDVNKGLLSNELATVADQEALSTCVNLLTQHVVSLSGSGLVGSVNLADARRIAIRIQNQFPKIPCFLSKYIAKYDETISRISAGTIAILYTR